MQDLLFIDIETDKNGKLSDFGALRGEHELHERHIHTFKRWIERSEIICGHNIVLHDIPELKKEVGDAPFVGKKYVDTLLWSPLIFAQNPYHKLVKGYKIVNSDYVNNPLSDCKLTRNLLYDELNAFHKLSDDLKNAFYKLLGDHPSFRHFFWLADYSGTNDTLFGSVARITHNKICDYVELLEISSRNPVELAYVLALINTQDVHSILPEWVRRTYPACDEILDELRFGFCDNDLCVHCSTKLNPKKALSEYFGYDDFRKFDEHRAVSLQEETVRAGLKHESFLAVFPTGGGKSLTFQLPALMRGEATQHLTVVISPLVSLMKDQVDNLETKFNITQAVSINGLLSPLERAEAMERVQTGKAHILYISPESLRSPSIFKLISSRSIARFVIDEAHCFSSWGQDFRVDYLYIGEFIQKLKEKQLKEHIPVSCFTATAKPQVIQDIKVYFAEKLGLELQEFITKKGRTNLSYEVIEVADAERKMPLLLQLIDRCEKPAIVYASRTKRVEKVCALLNNAGFESSYFHGKLDKDQKKEQMNAFMSGQTEIIVATSAFGMGVDKEDVKTVIHYNISDSLENYVQEAGRAGRSEQIEAKCYILFSESDLDKHFSLLQQTKINKKEIEEIWRAIKLQAKNRSRISQSALEIAKLAGWDSELRELETRVTTAISTLEDKGFLKRQLNSPQVFADSLMVPNFAKGQQRIMESKKLTERDKEDCTRILQRIIKDQEARLDYIADRTDLNIHRVQSGVQLLRELNILGDAKDLTAFINLTRSHKSSRNVLKSYLKLESALFKLLDKENAKIQLRHINQQLLDMRIADASIAMILRVFNYWEIRGFISKKRVDREKERYSINFKHPDELEKDLAWRHNLVVSVLQQLETFAMKQPQKSGQKDDIPVTFSLIELRDSNRFFDAVVDSNTKRYELCLLYLNQIRSITLEGGFMVSYNKFNIEQIDKSKPRFTHRDYLKMDEHYMHKTEQIHIVGEYARRCLNNYESALSYVNDYFSLSYNEFLSRYFPSRKGEIRRPLTAERFKEIIKELDTDQTAILNDNQSSHILVLAGPGSGKTKVLVHKIASLLLLEDIKPEQFLMLTFSKSAALEFKSRTWKLVPEFAGLVKITTFHGFCFGLLGQLGDLEKSQNVIQLCIKAIRNEEVDLTTIQNKSVLLLDEFQDVNADEWELIKTIMEVAGNMRVIAVGDDDQTIYEFRGAKNDFMNAFRTDFSATTYSLVKNYRSRKGIITFNNELLKKVSSRFKTEELVPAQLTEKAIIRLNQFKEEELVQPFVDALVKDHLKGTKAVLVRTNIEALIVHALLKEKGIKAKLIAGFDGFTLSTLLEIRFFSERLKQGADKSGLISEQLWEEAVQQFRAEFVSNPHFEVCLALFRKFQETHPENKLLVEWWDFAREMKMEDLIEPEKESLIISTMHKAKGKEFDHVWILSQNRDYALDKQLRLLYVACSRAKESLHIFTNEPFFDTIACDEDQRFRLQTGTMTIKNYEVILSVRNVYLGSQKYPKTIPHIEALKTNEELKPSTVHFKERDGIGLGNLNSQNVLFFSRDFIENVLNRFQQNGFELVSGKVEYIVFWYDKETDREYKVIVPRVRFQKKLSITDDKYRED